jgi:serine/threonine-protein kinase
MKAENWQKVKAIFDAVIEVAPNEHPKFLDDACGGDAELRREIEGLLTASDAAGSFMETPFAAEIAHLFTVRKTDQLEPGQDFSRYKIIAKVGEGGMGEVYLARDTQLKRRVALKLLAPDIACDSDQLRRLVREARVASALNHPNIVTVYEIGQSDTVHFISTEFVEGDTLRRHLSRSPLKLSEAVDIAIEIASALVVAHDADVVHTDIKPENIMLREDGLLKVLDFGLATHSRDKIRLDDSHEATWNSVKTNPGRVMGTVAYMSPEQVRGDVLDARTDIWSLGVVMYEMIVGRPPFAGSSPVDVLAAILKDEPEPIKLASPRAPARLQRIITKSLSKSPDERYQTVSEVLLDLKGVRGETETDSSEPRSVAILPFKNITGNASETFFEFALADGVITELARSRSLTVRPSSAIAKYLGKTNDPLAIGRELKVDAILAANFLVTEKRIRVTTQLIDVINENVIWSELIDSGADDIIGLQDTITHRIVDGLKCELETPSDGGTSVPRTPNSLAYMEYLRGRDQFRRYVFHTAADENVEIAIEHFQRAIDHDPHFALAYCALGSSYIHRVLKAVGACEDVENATAALDQAIALDPQIIEARAYRTVITRLQGETEKSRVQMAELRRDAPNNFDVQYLSAAFFRFDGDYESVFRCYSEMLRIDPTAKVAVHCFRARMFWYQGKFDDSFRELDKASALEPNHFFVKVFRAVATFHSGDAKRAAALFRDFFGPHPSPGFRPYFSMCLSALGERAAALKELTAETERVAEVDPDVSYWLASAYLMAEETDLALKWLERTIADGNRNLPWFESNPVWKPMSDNPRFKELMSGLRSNTFNRSRS